MKAWERLNLDKMYKLAKIIVTESAKSEFKLKLENDDECYFGVLTDRDGLFYYLFKESYTEPHQSTMPPYI